MNERSRLVSDFFLLLFYKLFNFIKDRSVWGAMLIIAGFSIF